MCQSKAALGIFFLASLALLLLFNLFLTLYIFINIKEQDNVFCSTDNLKSHVHSMAASVIRAPRSRRGDEDKNETSSDITVTGENVLITAKGNYVMLGRTLDIGGRSIKLRLKDGTPAMLARTGEIVLNTKRVDLSGIAFGMKDVIASDVVAQTGSNLNLASLAGKVQLDGGSGIQIASKGHIDMSKVGNVSMTGQEILLSSKSIRLKLPSSERQTDEGLSLCMCQSGRVFAEKDCRSTKHCLQQKVEG